MTDQQLAQNLRDADRDGDVDNIIYCENEIAARLNLPLDETEQGLTPEASQAIVDFCTRTGGFVMTEILDRNGTLITVGARVLDANGNEDGTVYNFTEPDCDVNEYGRAVPLGPFVLVQYDDGTTERWAATWNATGPWDDHRTDYTCDDVAVATDGREPDGQRIEGGRIVPTSR